MPLLAAQMMGLTILLRLFVRFHWGATSMFDADRKNTTILCPKTGEVVLQETSVFFFVAAWLQGTDLEKSFIWQNMHRIEF